MSPGYFVCVLHMHLPFVLNHGRWPHGSDWLSEVAVHCYLPLLQVFLRLVREGISPRLTVSISPVLCEQLTSDAFQKEIQIYLDHRLSYCVQNRQYFSETGEGVFEGLTDFWKEYYTWALGFFSQTLKGDIVRSLRELAEEGHIELVTTPATHGYLPLLGSEESIAFQLRQAVTTHKRHFGQTPRGVWLSECGYRPGYTWTFPAGAKKGSVSYPRRGIEEFVAENGLDYFFADSHLVTGGEPPSIYKGSLPHRERAAGWVLPPFPAKERSSYEAYLVSSGQTGGVAVFPRDPKTTVQVWSREGGYPGDSWYLDFHKRHFPGGLKFWRVTDPRGDLAKKEVYSPQKAQERVRGHAHHFVELVKDLLKDYSTLSGKEGVVCSFYDAELFGHWWFEGPEWLYHVLRLLREDGVETTTGSGYLLSYPPTKAITLPEGSWGEGGDHRVWLNKETEWTWGRIYEAEEEIWSLVRRASGVKSKVVDRLLSQVARELLLLQASDWQFLITTRAAQDYACMRFAEHYADFKKLAFLTRMALDQEDPTAQENLIAEEEGFLSQKEQQDFLFPDVDFRI